MRSRITREPREPREPRRSLVGTQGAARLRAVALLMPLVLASTGCAGLGASDSDATETCLLAEAVGTTPSEEVEAVSKATIALAEALPESLQSAALLLAQPPQTADDTASLAMEQSERLRALAELQGWAMETCSIYLTIGAPVDVGLEAAEARLADFETVTGEDAGGVYVSVLGVSREDIALVLCKQALAAHAGAAETGTAAAGTEAGTGTSAVAGTAEAEREVHVQVLDPIGQTLAYSDSGSNSEQQECALAASGAPPA